MTKKILITGATGFIGKNLVRILAENKENDITVMLRKDSDENELKGIRYKTVLADVLDKSSLSEIKENFDTIYHLAAFISFNSSDYQKMMNVNLEGTKNLADFAKEHGVKTFVFANTASVFGMPKSKPVLNDENSFFDPKYKKSGYMFSKKCAGDYLKSVDFMRCVSVHPTTVYGWGDLTLNSGAVIKKIYRGIGFAPPGGTSIIGVKDVARGFILAEEKGRHGESYILTSKNVTYFDLFKHIAETLEVKVPRFKLPKLMKYGVIPAAFCLNTLLKFIGKSSTQLTPEMMNFIFSFRYFSGEKAKNELGFIAEQPFEETIKEAFEYYKEKGLI